MSTKKQTCSKGWKPREAEHLLSSYLQVTFLPGIIQMGWGHNMHPFHHTFPAVGDLLMEIRAVWWVLVLSNASHGAP